MGVSENVYITRVNGFYSSADFGSNGRLLESMVPIVQRILVVMGDA